MFYRYVSHRARGYNDVEMSRRALCNALNNNIRGVELNTRVSCDGVLYMHHDSVLNPSGHKLHELHSSEIDELAYINGEKILSYQQCLRIFKMYSSVTQRLFIDIKDFGYEEEHYNLAKEAGVLDRVCFISWIPQTLIKLHTIDESIPLYLSYLPSPAAGVISSCQLKFGDFVIHGKNRFASELTDLSVGLRHCYVADELPILLLESLKRSGGGVSVNYRLLDSRSFKYFEEKDLNVILFSAKTYKELKSVIRKYPVKIVLCDFKF